MANRTKSIPTCIGENIRQLRQRASLTQKALGEKLYKSESAVRMWELGKSEPDGDTLINIANIFKISVDDILGNQVSPSPNLSPLPQQGMRIIPIYETVSAGFGAQADDRIIDYLPCFIQSESEAKNSIAIKVKGDSMYPKIEDGDIIRIIKQSTVENGQIAVVLIDGEGYVKRVNFKKDSIELESFNPNYPPMRFKENDVERVRIVGLVKNIIKSIQ